MVEESWQIAGIIASFFGVCITIILTFYVRHLDKKQQERDESFFKAMTIKNIQQLNEHLIKIQDISECEEETPKREEQTEIVQELNKYTSRNKRLLESLISDTKFSMSKWPTLDTTGKEDIDYLIETTNWVLDEYLPKSNENEDTQKRRLTDYITEFIKRKKTASEKVNHLIQKYS